MGIIDEYVPGGKRETDASREKRGEKEKKRGEDDSKFWAIFILTHFSLVRTQRRPLRLICQISRYDTAGLPSFLSLSLFAPASLITVPARPAVSWLSRPFDTCNKQLFLSLLQYHVMDGAVHFAVGKKCFFFTLLIEIDRASVQAAIDRKIF